MIKNLIFRGGGVLGIAYAGALKVLETDGVLDNIQCVAGTSAGAMTALLVGLKYTPDEIYDIINKCDFSSFEDGDLLDEIKIFDKFGIHPGKSLLSWAESLVAAKTGKANATFQDLKDQRFLDINIVTCNLHTQNYKVFSASKTPGIIVSEAVRASMSIPLFFWAWQFSNDPTQELYVDGGTMWNYPIDIFDNGSINEETLGLYLTEIGSYTYPNVKPGQPKQYIAALLNCILGAQDLYDSVDPDTIKRTIKIDDLGISATDFGLTDTQKTNLYNSGINCAKAQINNFLKS